MNCLGQEMFLMYLGTSVIMENLLCNSYSKFFYFLFAFRDALGRGRFFPFVPEHHLMEGSVPKDFWYWKYIFYPSEEVSTEGGY